MSEWIVSDPARLGGTPPNSKPLKVDETAASASPALAAFLVRPESAPVYHRFPIVPETNHMNCWFASMSWIPHMGPDHRQPCMKAEIKPSLLTGRASPPKFHRRAAASFNQSVQLTGATQALGRSGGVPFVWPRQLTPSVRRQGGDK
jgi:hypothetical protein